MAKGKKNIKASKILDQVKAKAAKKYKRQISKHYPERDASDDDFTTGAGGKDYFLP